KVFLDRFHLVCLLFSNDGKKDLLQGWLFFHILHLSRWKQLFELQERAAGDNLSLMENGNAISKLFCLFQVLRSQEDGSATISKLLHHFPHLDACLGVKPGGWFVKEKDWRCSHQAHGEIKPAAHPA